MQQSTKLHTSVSYPECSTVKSVARSRVFYILTAISCCAAIVSVSLALVFLCREQTNLAQLLQVNEELREIKAQLVELQSRCGSVVESTVVPDETDDAVSHNVNINYRPLKCILRCNRPHDTLRYDLWV